MRDNSEKKATRNTSNRKMDPDIRRALEKTKERYDQAFKNLRDR